MKQYIQEFQEIIESLTMDVNRCQILLNKLKQEQREKDNLEYCEKNGHDWVRAEYVGIGDTNYYTCRICGEEKQD